MYETWTWVSWPVSSDFFAFAGSSANGVLVLMPRSLARALSSRSKYCVTLAPAHGWIAPSSSYFDGSGTSSSGSTSIRVPSPEQTGQAPYGELKENERGSSSSIASG